ncbi:hypothetical protein [Oricola sp.]|uniref:hypothetical protein n=1 Tax=Oricola sp. TaxID=1979950 RepID=UPI003513F9E1
MADDFFTYELIEEITFGTGERPVRFYKRTPIKEAKERRFSEKDVAELLALGAAAAISILPSRYWPSYPRLATALRYRREYRKGFAGFAESMKTVLGIDDESQCEALFKAHLENSRRRRMMFAIDEVARRRNPRIDLIGADMLREALGRKQGAIVWASQFAFQTLAGKRALWEAGFEPIQISVHSHGFSDTAFGNVTINPMLRRAENRYLKDRIVFERASGSSVTRKILSLLDQGELIILTNNVYAGNMFVELGFGERGYVSMPTSPLSIVARRGTPFFSLATLETGPLSRLEAKIDPIKSPDARNPAGYSGGRNYAVMADLALVARDMLFRHYCRAPDQYLLPASLSRSWLDPS